MATLQTEDPDAEETTLPPYLVETTSSGQIALFLAMMTISLLILIGLMVFG